MDLFAPRHLLIILLVVLLVFGTKKLKNIGSDLGSAVKGFKKAMSDGENEEQAAKKLGAPAEADADFSDPTRSGQKTPPGHGQS